MKVSSAPCLGILFLLPLRTVYVHSELRRHLCFCFPTVGALCYQYLYYKYTAIHEALVYGFIIVFRRRTRQKGRHRDGGRGALIDGRDEAAGRRSRERRCVSPYVFYLPSAPCKRGAASVYRNPSVDVFTLLQ
jgi:hypothetical protein